MQRAMLSCLSPYSSSIWTICRLINLDNMGHDAGSLALKRFGAGLAAASVQDEVLGRIGGDEFVVAGEFSEEEIQFAAERLERTVTELDFDLRIAYPLAFNFR